MEDLEDVISSKWDALSLCPPGHPDRFPCLNNLACSLMKRFNQLGNLEDLEISVLFYREALDLCPPEHPERPTSINNLAHALMSRYDQLGETDDLEDSISFYRNALTLCHPGHPGHSTLSSNLAHALVRRYKQLGEVGDLEDAISIYRDELSLLPPDHPGRSTGLNNLAAALVSRYEQLGHIEDLEDSISFQRDSLSLRPLGNPQRPTSLNNLANALMSRYLQFGEMGDLEESISLSCDALNLRPSGHPQRSTLMNNLANALMSRYRQLGKVEDLEGSISWSRDAIGLRPPGHPGRSASINNLAHALMSRYDQSGKTEDLEESISFHREALSLRPPGNPERSRSLNNLAHALMSRYDQLGKVEDLEDVISFYREALILRPLGHPGRSTPLNNLAHALMSRFDHLGKMVDLEDSISLYRDALNLLPLGHPHHSMSLNNLATALITRYDQLQKIGDLTDCITLYQDALTLRIPGHPGRSMTLNNLAYSLMCRYNAFGEMGDLEGSISCYHDALSLRPLGHPLRSTTLNHLSRSLMRQYEQFGKMSDLDNSISFQRDALSLCPSGHPERSTALANLASALMTRYREYGNMEDFQEIFICYEQVASDFPSYLQGRLRAAIRWTIDARDLRHKSTLLAYTTSLDLLDRSLVSRPSVESQQGFLATTDIVRSLASDAASAAIEEGNLELAVELLEQGRAILWAKVNAYKSPVEELRQVEGSGAELADRLEALSADLEHLALSSSHAETLGKEFSMGVTLAEAQMKQHRILSEEWEDLVGTARKIEGFGHFLKAPPFSILQSAAVEGPVIIVNVSTYRSDAIILCVNNPPILVTLPSVRPDDLVEQAKKLGSDRELCGVLRYLWDNIVSLVIDRLTEMGIRKKSRIWWCPTAELCGLPLHAAGPHRGGQKNLPDLYTSSYISTLSSLIRARSDLAQPVTIPKLLVVGQPSETLKLARVEVEVDIVKNLGPHESVDVLFGSNANCEAVLNGVKEHSWIHFACHGHLGKDSQPFHTSFELHDGRRLTLLELMQARLPNAELAFLSACHSAEGDSRTPDESIHLSAALQFCGFRSVVGTLWEMDDEDGPMISEEFYKYMFRNPEKIDFRDSAHALSSAIRAMRKAKLPAARWAMFVHIGA